MEKGQPMNLQDFQRLLEQKTPHALTRYGDGEWNIFDDVNCDRKGFKFNSETDQMFRQELKASYDFEQKNYFVADQKPISACLFVNEYYKEFLKSVGVFNLFPVIFIGNEKANTQALPFKIDAFYPVSNNAWKFHPNLHEEILSEVKKQKPPCLVLFACGPYSNILIHKIWQKNKKSILWNVGSVFDFHIFGRITRDYQKRIFDEQN